LRRFAMTMDSDTSKIGLEYHTVCRFCERSCTLYFPTPGETGKGVVRRARSRHGTRLFIIGGGAAREPCSGTSRERGVRKFLSSHA
jgi:hypothetical protein